LRVGRREQKMVAASVVRLVGSTVGRKEQHWAGLWAGVKAVPTVEPSDAKMAEMRADAMVGLTAGLWVSHLVAMMVDHWDANLAVERAAWRVVPTVAPRVAT